MVLLKAGLQYLHYHLYLKIGIMLLIIRKMVDLEYMRYFLDFRKAFDLVDHGILLWKPAELNVNKSFWWWIKSFLEGEVNK